MSSLRLPGKVLADIEGTPMIGYQLSRIRRSKLASKIVVATSLDKSDDPLVEYLKSDSQEYFRGSLEDVLIRFLSVLDIFNPPYFIRITGDCPLIMPDILDSMIFEFEMLNLDYLSNALEPSFPDGLDIEIVSASALRKLSLMPLSSTEREHVTLGLYSRPTMFNLRNFNFSKDLSNERWTVDYPEDLEFVRNVVKYEKELKRTVLLADIINFLEKNPELRNKVSGNLRNEALKEWRTQFE